MFKRTTNEQKRRVAILSTTALLLICVCAVCVAFFSNNAIADEPTGNDPVAKIGDKTYDDLHVALSACTRGQTVELLRDVELTGQWAPVGDTDNGFPGEFEGNNHKVTGLNISSGSNFLGMFNKIGSVATSEEGAIRNLTIENADISIQGDVEHAGVLAGYIYGTVTNVTISNAEVNIPSGKYVGGIAGKTDALVQNCKVLNSEFTGKDQVGALVGYAACAAFNYNTVTNNTVVATDERASTFLGKLNIDDGESDYYCVKGNTISGGSATAPDYAGGITAQIMGTMNNYDIKDNTIDTKLYAPKISPIGTLRPYDPEGSLETFKTFTSSLASKIKNNTWTANTYDNETYTYTADETKCTDQVIYGGPSEPVCKIGETTYTSIKAALDAANEGDTITILTDIELKYDATSKVSLDINKAVTIDGAGFSLTPKADTAWDVYKEGGTSQAYGSYNLVIVSASNATIKNLSVDVGDYRGLCCLTTKGGANISYDNITMRGKGCGHYAGVASAGWITFNKCDIQTSGYGINFSNNNPNVDVVINESILGGWNSLGVIDSLIVNDTTFKTTEDSKLGKMAGFRPYCPTTLTRCTFSKEYTMGTLDGYTYVGVGTGDTAVVQFYKCTVEKDGDNFLDIQNIINYKNAFAYDDAATNSVFLFNGKANDSSQIVYGEAQTKTASALPCAEGSAAVKVRDASGETEQSGSGALYLVGKGAEKTDGFITAGKFSVDPSAYINSETHTVVNSDDNECPYLVKVKETTDPKTPVIASEDVHVEVLAKVSEEEKTVVNEAALNSEVVGVSTAMKTDDTTQAEILEVAKSVPGSSITDSVVESASLIEFEITAEVKVKTCTSATTEEGSLKFIVKPVATVVTKVNGQETGKAENVEIDNSWLTGQEIEVTLGCGDIKPVQVAHILESGEVELFTKGSVASYSAKTFVWDQSAKTISIKVNQFSDMEIYGAANYASLTYDANGGTGKMEAQNVAIGSAATVESCAYTRDGYTFQGWNTKTDGSGTAYNEGDAITVESASGVVLYAQWTAVSPTPPVDPDDPGNTTNATAVQSSTSAQTGDNMLVMFAILLGVVAVSGCAIRSSRIKKNAK